MDARELFIEADRHLHEVIARIDDARWSDPLPEWFQQGTTNGTTATTVGEALNYLAYDEAWIPHTFRGETMQQVGDRYDGDLLGDDPATNFAALGEPARAAVAAVDPTDTVHFSYGDYPAGEALVHVSFFRTIRSVDFARISGQDVSVPDDVAQALVSEIERNGDEWRQYGIIPAEPDPIADDATANERLFALTGRSVALAAN